MSDLAKRITITILILAVPLAIGLLFNYRVIRIQWPSMMAIQPSFRPMEAPLPLPARSVPIEGAAYVPGAGSPANPTQPDAASVSRGKFLYGIACDLCHGTAGKGDGQYSRYFVKKPADLTSSDIRSLSDGEIFLIITNGIMPTEGTIIMPNLRENLSVADRWDVINYVRSLEQP